MGARSIGGTVRGAFPKRSPHWRERTALRQVGGFAAAVSVLVLAAVSPAAAQTPDLEQLSGGAAPSAVERAEVGGGTIGELAQKPGTAGCISDTGTSGDCQDGTALIFARWVAISPDGNNAYTASSTSGAVGVFDRDPSTGELTQKTGTAGCISNDGTGGDCQDGTALDGANSITISPDGNNAYTTSFNSDAVGVFDRDPGTGELTQKGGTAGCISNDGTGGDCQDGTALGTTVSVTISPDGNNAYTTSIGSDAVGVFDRDPGTGELTQKGGTAGCISETGTSGDCQDGTALDGTASVTISPDGNNAYVASRESAAVVVFDRDPGTGELTQKTGTAGCISETGTAGSCQDGTALDGALSVTISSDGNNAYTASLFGDAVAVFDRDPGTGELTQKTGTAGCISDTGTAGACTDGTALDGTASVTISPDGNNAYTTSVNSNAVGVFDRDPGTGELTQKTGTAGCISETGTAGACQDGTALDGATSVTISPDGNNAYTASLNSEAVAVFDRDRGCAAGDGLSVATEAEYRAALACASSDPTRLIELTADIDLVDDINPIYLYPQPLTIDGNGHTINGGAAGPGAVGSRVLAHLSNTLLTVRHLTVAEATTPGDVFGGALASNGPITVEGSTFIGNTSDATGGGGAIGAFGAVTVTDSTFLDNRGDNGGGAITAAADVTVTRSSFRFNQAPTGNGGAINSGGTITVVDSTLIANTAGDNGGAIGTAGNVHVANTTISGNTATTGVGGGINSLGRVTHDHATIVANTSGTGGANIDADELGGGPPGSSRFASVIALPGGGRPNCDFTSVAAASTAGHNYSDDTSCFLQGQDDIENGTDPLLGPVRDNGTVVNPVDQFTLFPLNGSPLVDAIPNQECSDAAGLDVDQRGVPRPFPTGGACDIGAIEAVFPAHTFTDATPFFEPTIRWVTSTVNEPQILNGFPNGTFGQELNITRGQAARLYFRGAGSPDPLAFDPHGFGDVTPFYEDAVRWAKGVGLFNGFPDNTFRQNDPITRGQYIRSLYNFAGAQDPTQVGPHGLTDVTPFYEDAVRWAKGRGLANGFPDNTFRQNDDIKRGNAARTFYNTAQTPTAWNDPNSAPPNMVFQTNLPT